MLVNYVCEQYESGNWSGDPVIPELISRKDEKGYIHVWADPGTFKLAYAQEAVNTVLKDRTVKVILHSDLSMPAFLERLSSREHKYYLLNI